MIIVNQDKTLILNFDNVISICLDDQKTKRKIYAFNVNSNIVLGEYKTEERAKEVLGEIINVYKGTEAFKVVSGRILDSTGAVAINKGFVYEMPED